ncbi:MAG: hypothetical protein ACRCTZ_08180 [Sarcina sp.]
MDKKYYIELTQYNKKTNIGYGIDKEVVPIYRAIQKFTKSEAEEVVEKFKEAIKNNIPDSETRKEYWEVTKIDIKEV